MSTGLKQQWGLKDPKGPPSTAQADQFKAAYQASANVINQSLQYTAVNAEKAKHAAFAAKRDKLASAYQAVLAKINPRNPAAAQSSIDATLGTAKALADKATEFKSETEKALQAWQAVEAAFEAAVNQVEELEAWPDKRAGTLRAVVAKVQEQVNKKMFLEAVKTFESFKTKLQPIYDEYLKQKEAKGKYEAALPALQTKVGEASECRYKKLEPMQKEFEAGKTSMETAATNKDYVQALQLQGDLEAKLDAYQTAAKDLDAKKQQYEDSLAKVQTRLSAINASEAGKAGAIQEEMTTIQSEMQKAAEAEDFENALRLVGDLDAKLTEFETLFKKRDEYKQRLDALQKRLSEASQSKAETAYAQPIQADMAKIQTDMESAAAADDYEKALELLGQLEAKVEEYFAAIEKKKKEYEATRDAAVSKYDDCMVTARDFTELKPQRDGLNAKKKDMEAKATAEDYEGAKTAAAELEKLAADYLKLAAEKQKKYDEKGAEITKALDDAGYFSRDDVAREYANKLSKDELKYIPTAVRNRLMQEMQEGNFSGDDKAAINKMYAVRTLDPEFEKAEKKHRDKLIEMMRNDPELAKARDDWPTLSKEKRVEMMEKVAKYHAEAYNTDPSTFKVKSYDKDPKKDKDGNVVSWNNGVYSHSSGTMTINTNPYWDAAKKQGVSFNDFDKSLDLVTHEAGHRYQHVLAERVKNGDIKPDDPEYEQAVAFKLNTDYYVQPEPDFTVYENQPMEAHSRISGHADDADVGKDHHHDHHHH